MKLNQLFAEEYLEEMVDKGYVRFGTHKEFPELRIYEYTAKAMFDREWNAVTTKTRGLIVNWDTKEIVARPFDKFFNYGEPSQLHQIRLEPNDEVVVFDKMDGSLGILYRRPDGHIAVATKGSFHSEQADWATKEIRKYMTTHFDPEDTTWLFEIIYPENRIVVTYDFSGLVLLGARDIESGDEYFPDDLLEWKGRKAAQFRYQTLREALEAPPRRNAEGFVVYLPEFDVRVKIKQEDYLKLHKTVFSFGPQYIYDRLDQGKSEEEILAGLPDEFHKEAQSLMAGFLLEHMRIRSVVLRQYREIMAEHGDVPPTKKEFAQAVQAHEYEYPQFMYSLFDKQHDHAERIWKTLNPSYVKMKTKKASKKR